MRIDSSRMSANGGGELRFPPRKYRASGNAASAARDRGLVYFAGRWHEALGKSPKFALLDRRSFDKFVSELVSAAALKMLLLHF